MIWCCCCCCCCFDDPEPAVAPGFIRPIPVRVNLDDPPVALLQLVAVECGFTSEPRIFIAAQGVQLILELLSNRRMHESLSHRPEFMHQGLHDVYNNFTRGFIAYCCYCVGRIEWNSTISAASPTVALLQGYDDDDEFAAAEAFGQWIVRLYPRLDRRNTWHGMRLRWGHRFKGLLHFNLEHFFDEQRRRLRRGGIHSAAWIAREINQRRPLQRNYTQGMLYQHVLLMGRVTMRLDDYLDHGHLWHLTEEQRGCVEDLEDAKVYDEED